MNPKPLSLFDIEQIRQWRNEQLELLRTPYPLTQEQQEQFYREVVCDRGANARYWAVEQDKVNPTACYSIYISIPGVNPNLIGMAGLENIQWENRLAEISLLLAPGKWQYAPEALRFLLREGFLNLNLLNIYSEVYACNPYIKFWSDMAIKYNCLTASLPYRKHRDGLYYSSTYINFNKEDYLNHENLIAESVSAVN